MIHFILSHTTSNLSRNPLAFISRIYLYSGPWSVPHCYQFVLNHTISSLHYGNNPLSGFSVSLCSPPGIHSHYSKQSHLFKTCIQIMLPSFNIFYLKINVKAFTMVYKVPSYLFSSYFSDSDFLYFLNLSSWNRLLCTSVWLILSFILKLCLPS